VISFRARSIAATLLLAVCVIALYRRHELVARTAPYLVLQGAAALLMLWARWTFGRRSFHFAANPTDGGLVTSGPYRFTRNPIYLAVLLFVWAGVVGTHASLAGLALAGVVTVLTLVRIAAEERFLRAEYAEYAAYASTTKRLIPFLLTLALCVQAHGVHAR
jgi:protein-S-isoprenylcysteine O-methyltransferase Ste14